MKVENGNYCPLVRGKCKGLECTWMIQIRGTNPQTGTEVDEWDCAVKWLPMLLIENAQQTRQAGAATESMRNEIIKRMDTPLMLPELPQHQQKPALYGGGK